MSPRVTHRTELSGTNGKTHNTHFIVHCIVIDVQLLLELMTSDDHLQIPLNKSVVLHIAMLPTGPIEAWRWAQAVNIALR